MLRIIRRVGPVRYLPALVCAPFAALAGSTSHAQTLDLVVIDGGVAGLGDTRGDENEIARRIEIGTFQLMRHEVTVAQFADFVSQTEYVTEAEELGRGYVWTGRWGLVDGAQWRHPRGPETSIDGRSLHPVTQVSQRDAEAFCTHYGLRLPSEDEWEYAARGREGRRYPWGDEEPGSSPSRRANFGTVTCCAADDEDGWTTTAPVGSYTGGASPFGLIDMAGNVWERTSSLFPGREEWFVIKGGGWGNNPYCLRAAYRHGNRPSIGLDMVGFRCAGDAELTD